MAKEGQEALRRSRLLRGLVTGLFLFPAVSLILIFQFLPKRVDLAVGEVSPVDIRAPRQVTYISQLRTEEEVKKAEEGVEDIYQEADPEITRQAISRARQVFDYVDSVRHDEYATEAKKVALLRAIPDVTLPLTVISDTITLEEETWQGVKAESLRVLDEVLREDIRPGQVSEVKHGLPGYISLTLPPTQSELVEAWARNFVVANSFFDQEATEQARAQARAAVEPAYVTINKGAVVIREGDVVTPEVWEALGALGLRQVAIEWPTIAAQAFFALIVVTILILYIYLLHPSFWDNRRQILLLAFLFLLFTLGAKLMTSGQAFWAYLFPLATLSMLLAALVNADLAILITALLSLTMGFVSGSLELAVYGFVGGVISALALHRVERLNSFLWAGGYLALANALMVLLFRLLEREQDLMTTLALLGGAMGNGALAASLTLAGFYVLGNLLGFTTTLRLLELARPNHPLLRELLLKAPGSYHHSLMVSNLAEQAAEAIGANSLLARVGAYYHDVGKVRRPYFFVENQGEGVNVHEHLDPKTSAQMVIAHVKDGLELAKKFDLPEAIRDFVPQHHGTSRADYFYREAKEQGEVSEEEFRYPGPRPRSREAAILMLADAVEAAVRAESPSSPEEMEKIVRGIMEARLAEGQLNESDLTLRDLEKIRDSFSRILEGVYHPRIRYPEESKEEASDEGGPDGADRSGPGDNPG